jgi:hypothetical protein
MQIGLASPALFCIFTHKKKDKVMTRIEELLEKRQMLVEVAALMYGDMYVINEEFWKSDTEREMFDIEAELEELGHEEEGITPEMEAAAWMLFEALKKGGMIPDKDEEEDEENAQ